MKAVHTFFSHFFVHNHAFWVLSHSVVSNSLCKIKLYILCRYFVDSFYQNFFPISGNRFRLWRFRHGYLGRYYSVLLCCIVAKSCLTCLQPHRLQPSRLLWLWNFPGKNIGVSCYFLLQGIFPTQGSYPCLWCLLNCRHLLYHWATWRVPLFCLPQAIVDIRS